MRRYIGNDGIEVGANAFNVTNESISFNVQRRSVDGGRPGRASGLTVTLGTPASRLTVAAGYGYDGRGDYIESAGTANLAMRDYNTGIENLIVVCYREVAGTPQAHESDGTTRDTIATTSSEIKVFTRTEYAALSATTSSDLATNLSTANLAGDAQDRMIIIAGVLGKGFTGPTPNVYVLGDFTNGNITHPDLFSEPLSAALPASPAISGINLTQLTSTTLLGTGTLTLTVTTPTNKTLSWAAPNALGTPEAAGTPIAIDTTQTMQELILVSSSPYGIGVEVFPSLLPTASQSDSVVISQVFVDTAGPYSTKDALLRSKKGRYLPRDTNPNGIGYTDLGEFIVNIAKPVVLGSDILASEATALMPRITTRVSTAASVDRTLLWEIPGGSGTNGYTRLYKTASTGTHECTTNMRWDGTQWVKDVAADSSSFNQGTSGMEYFYHASVTTPFAPAAMESVWSTREVDSAGVPQGLLKFGGYQGAGAVTRPRVQTQISGANPRTLLWRTDASTGSMNIQRVYASTIGFEITTNAVWGGSSWSKDDTIIWSSKTLVSPENFNVYWRDVGAGTWTDGTWTTTTFSVDNPNNQITTGRVNGSTLAASIAVTAPIATLSTNTNTPVISTLYTENFAKVQGAVVTDGAGGFTAGQVGFNYTASFQTAPNRLRLTFGTAFNSNAYNLGGSILFGSNAVVTRFRHDAVSATVCDIHFFDDITTPGTPIVVDPGFGGGAVIVGFSFIITGRQ